jgi:hypothetical protein
MHTTVDIERPTPPDTYPPIFADHPGPSPVTTAVGGAAVGAALGAAFMYSKKLGDEKPAADNPPKEEPRNG